MFNIIVKVGTALTLRSLIASMLFLAAPAAMADVILHYSLSGVTMTGGGMMAGSFDWNASISRPINYNITVPTNSYGPATNFNTDNSFYLGPAFSGIGNSPMDSGFNIILNSFQGYLNLIFDRSLANGGTVGITTSTERFESFFSHNDFTGDLVVAGDVTTESGVHVPEPATLALFALGLLPLVARRRRAAPVTR
jgi:hypothetical protein